MLSELAIAACLAMGPSQCTTCGPSGGGMEYSGGGAWNAGGGPGNPYDAVAMGGGGGGDQLYPFDSPEPWLHGWFQEIPAYGGYHTFRPHNYKHVISQMEVAGRWGISPVMPYSHQWYHPFRQRAGMHPDFGHQQANSELNQSGALTVQAGSASVSAQPASLAFTQPQPEVQPVGAFQRGYTGTPIPGISTPYYQVPAAPATSAPSQEYLERLEQLQKQLEQQTFQMQVMQEQLRNQPPPLSSLQPWQLPNYTQFPEYQQPQASQGYQQPGYQGQSYQQQGYQDVPQPPTGGLAVQPAVGSGGYVPAGVYGGNLAPGLGSPYGAGGYQPSVMPNGMIPQGAPLMMPAPATSMLPHGNGYYSAEGLAPYANPTVGYPQGSPQGAAHANYSVPTAQPTLAAPHGSSPSWASPNIGALPQGSVPQAFNPAAVNPTQQSVPSAQAGTSTGFRPFGRFLR